jgi:hypothetical protein
MPVLLELALKLVGHDEAISDLLNILEEFETDLIPCSVEVKPDIGIDEQQLLYCHRSIRLGMLK